MHATFQVAIKKGLHRSTHDAVPIFLPALLLSEQANRNCSLERYGLVDGIDMLSPSDDPGTTQFAPVVLILSVSGSNRRPNAQNHSHLNIGVHGRFTIGPLPLH
jgi:hypothetical protein